MATPIYRVKQSLDRLGTGLPSQEQLRDCFAEPVLSEILRSLRFLRMTGSEGLAMTIWVAKCPDE